MSMWDDWKTDCSCSITDGQWSDYLQHPVKKPEITTQKKTLKCQLMSTRVRRSMQNTHCGFV